MFDTMMFNDLVSSTGLSDVTSFMSSMSANSDVGSTLLSASLAFKLAIYFIMFCGAIAMAIWIARIGVDILLIATNGMGKLEDSFIGKMGTKSGNYGSVGAYLKGNFVEIVLVIVLISFLMTGWLFTIISMALTGFGLLANKVFNLDVDGGLSKMSASAFTDNIGMLRATEVKVMYDDNLGNLKSQANTMYTYASDGVDTDSDQWIKASRLYSAYMSKTHLLSKEGAEDKSTLKVSDAYFEQHLNSSDICNTAFLDGAIIGYYKISESELSCSTRKD